MRDVANRTKHGLRCESLAAEYIYGHYGLFVSCHSCRRLKYMHIPHHQTSSRVPRQQERPLQVEELQADNRVSVTSQHRHR